jgi:hypothetical protein
MTIALTHLAMYKKDKEGLIVIVAAKKSSENREKGRNCFMICSYPEALLLHQGSRPSGQCQREELLQSYGKLRL